VSGHGNRRSKRLGIGRSKNPAGFGRGKNTEAGTWIRCASRIGAGGWATDPHRGAAISRVKRRAEHGGGFFGRPPNHGTPAKRVPTEPPHARSLWGGSKTLRAWWFCGACVMGAIRRVVVGRFLRGHGAELEGSIWEFSRALCSRKSGFEGPAGKPEAWERPGAERFYGVETIRVIGPTRAFYDQGGTPPPVSVVKAEAVRPRFGPVFRVARRHPLEDSGLVRDFGHFIGTFFW